MKQNFVYISRNPIVRSINTVLYMLRFQDGRVSTTPNKADKEKLESLRSKNKEKDDRNFDKAKEKQG